VTGVDGLSRGRALAESAAPLRLKRLAGHLLVVGRIADGEPYVARAIVATAPIETCDLGLVIMRFSRLQDALSMTLGGWIAVRVAPGSRIVGPTYEDYRLARKRLDEMGLGWRIPCLEAALT
jgi:hypothetical protein